MLGKRTERQLPFRTVTTLAVTVLTGVLPVRMVTGAKGRAR